MINFIFWLLGVFTVCLVFIFVKGIIMVIDSRQRREDFSDKLDLTIRQLESDIELLNDHDRLNYKTISMILNRLDEIEKSNTKEIKD